jgi:putative component of membrane protein insertase Oxa1/YidC/SpoIIIJ protein YidD
MSHQKLNYSLSGFQKMPGSLRVNLLLLLLLIPALTRAQFMVPDSVLINGADQTDHQYEKRHITFLASNSNSAIVKYNPFTLAFGSLLYFYQGVLSPQISAECRFRMSCSVFSKEAIREFGLIKGIALTSDRIMKCNRLAMADARPGDFDELYKIYDTPIKYRIRR